MKNRTKETKKKRLSDEEFRDILFSELNKGNEKAHLKTNFYELLCTKNSVAKGRALKLHGISFLLLNSRISSTNKYFGLWLV